ncbi:hypothetical protein AHAS_Ahas01G0193700 [Arachis hypogaea]
MALRWLVHLTCHVLGYYPIDKNVEEGLTHQEYPITCLEFQMPLHYPRYTKGDYEIMEEWKVDLLLQQYGLASRAPFMTRGLFIKRFIFLL